MHLDEEGQKAHRKPLYEPDSKDKNRRSMFRGGRDWKRSKTRVPAVTTPFQHIYKRTNTRGNGGDRRKNKSRRKTYTGPKVCGRSSNAGDYTGGAAEIDEPTEPDINEIQHENKYWKDKDDEDRQRRRRNRSENNNQRRGSGTGQELLLFEKCDNNRCKMPDRKSVV